MSEHIFEVKEVITRKPHHCWGCDIAYPANIRMNNVKAVQDGEFQNNYWCLNCQACINEAHGEDAVQAFPAGAWKEDWQYLDKDYNVVYKMTEKLYFCPKRHEINLEYKTCEIIGYSVLNNKTYHIKAVKYGYCEKCKYKPYFYYQCTAVGSKGAGNERQ